MIEQADLTLDRYVPLRRPVDRPRRWSGRRGGSPRWSVGNKAKLLDLIADGEPASFEEALEILKSP